MDTGDGILGTNMYAYCQNDCVNRVDPSGYASWWEKSGLGYAGEIHKAVQVHIMAVSRLSGITLRDEYVNSNGRADLVDLKTREVWEIKPLNRKYMGQASKQLNKYIAALEAETGKTWTKGGTSIGTNWVHFPFKSKTGKEFMVSYKNVGQGVIMYDYTPMDEWNKKNGSMPMTNGGYNWIPIVAGGGLALSAIGVGGILLAPLLIPAAPAIPGAIIYLADYFQQKAA
jgi:hypothetical protein